MLQALIVDDEPDFLESLVELVREEGFSVSTATSLAEARARLEQGAPDLILTDLRLPDGTGIELLGVVERIAGCDVILITGQGTFETAVAALRLRAMDYLTKPIDLPRLRAILGHVIRNHELREEIGSLRQELRQFGHFGPLVGSSPAMQKVYDLIEKVAPTNASVFLTGESGTGKELVAETIHGLSRRRSKPFIPINCGAMPATLIESELFGHERGSFSGAVQMRRGHFERASGGTLFLDEITEMPIDLQVKLLRVLETGVLLRVGGEAPVPMDVRIIAATNRPPEQAVKEGKLREDVLYRLNVFPIALPPFRDRKDDALLLAEHFLQQFNQTEGAAKRFSPEYRAYVLGRTWSGNAREIRNEIHRAFIMADRVIDVSDEPRPSEAAPAAGDGPIQRIPVGASLDDIEKRMILATLEHCGNDKRKAASLLGISLKTLYNRLNAYDAV
jgi:DNA-binding NtrC family response regulator